MRSRVLTATASVAIASCGFAFAQISDAADQRTDQVCAELFKQFNTSRGGKMDAKDVAANPSSQRAFNDPVIHKKGYLTEAEFTSVCAGADQPPASGLQ